MSTEFGPYRLVSRIGKGGVGQVWSAETGPHRTSVAMKILPPRVGAVSVEDFHRAFRNEVEAAASLDHPNVVAIYDFGYGDEDTELATDGLVPAGSCWLVMERVHGRSLYGYRARLTWRQLRRILLDVLDALAHAHARQVIHRDIKPSNVLVTPDGMATKLTDFGLAAFLAPRSTSAPHLSRATGTPSYMSPEQIMGQWFRQGPWTDLYGLGCLVYTMVHGDPMFRTLESIDAMHRHLLGQLPPFEPKMDLPPRFHDWVRSLLHTNPTERPRTAADAAHALRRIEDDDIADAPAPVPRDWRTRAFPAPLYLGASSLALYGLRTFRVAGRETVRTRLWSALRHVWSLRTRHVTLIRGPAGIGKTRLLEWLTERALETGAARVWRAPAGADSVLHAASTMVQQGFYTDGVPSEVLRSQIAERVAPVVLPTTLIDALVILATRPHDVVDPAAVLADLFRRLAWDRPVLLAFDDVHASPALLDLALRLSVNAEPIGLYLVAAGIDDQLAAQPELLGHWTRMADDIVDLGPLEREDGIALLSHSLDLEPKLAAAVMRRVEGNPSHAVELVGAWLQEGTVRAGEQGFELSPNQKLGPPQDLHRLWLTRLDPVLDSLPGDEWKGLALAAVLGTQVDALEWTRAASVLGLSASWDAVEALTRARLARIDRRRGLLRRWSFAHVLVREALLERARTADLWVVLHGAAAAILPPDSLRAARHWLEAAAPERAIKPLTEALRQASDQDLVNQAEVVADLLEQALLETSVPSDDPRWYPQWIGRSRLAERRGSMDEARALAIRALDSVPAGSRAAMGTFRLLGRLDRRSGDFERAILHFERVIDWSREHRDPRLEALTRREVAFLHIRTGRFAEAERELQEALALFEGAGSKLGAATAIVMLGLIEKQRGNLDSAADAVNAAIAEGGAASIVFLASCKNNLADVERLRGNLDSAESLLQEAAALNRASGDEDWGTHLNTGLILLARGRAQDAREAIERAIRRRTDDRVFQVGHAALSVCAARLHDWSGYDDHLTEVEGLANTRFRVDLDLATLLEEAGRTALRKSQGERGRRALAMAEHQWQCLGRSPEGRPHGEDRW
jgi:eukaryotic-like serine/threonine-protein kinase